MGKPSGAVVVCVLDTPGNEREEDRAKQDLRARDAHGLLVVYSIASRPSFTDAKAILERCQNLRGSAGQACVLVGNKCDLESARQVPHEEARAFATQRGIVSMEASAKECVNVDESVLQLLRSCSQGGLQEEVQLVLLGASGVGKSALAVRFAQRQYVEQHVPTQQERVYRKEGVLVSDPEGQQGGAPARTKTPRSSVAPLGSGNPAVTHSSDPYTGDVMFSILDGCGDHAFSQLDADVVVLVASVSSASSLPALRDAHHRVQQVSTQRKEFLVALNKTDLPKSVWEVGESEAAEFASAVGAKLLSVSAKQDLGVVELFEEAARALVLRPDQTEIKAAILGEGGVGKTALISRFVHGNFVDEYDPSIEDSYRKLVRVSGLRRARQPPPSLWSRLWGPIARRAKRVRGALRSCGGN